MHPDEYQTMIDDPYDFNPVADGLNPSILGRLQTTSAQLTPRAPVYIVAREGEDFFDIEGVFASRAGAEAYIATQEAENIWGELFCAKWDVQP